MSVEIPNQISVLTPLGPGSELFPQRFMDQEPQKETEINTDHVVSFMNDVNAVNAARIFTAISVEAGLDLMNDEERKAFSVALDSGAKHGMEIDLHESEFITRIKGCEGAKEEEKYGESARVPLLEGHYGLGHYVNFEDRQILKDFDEDRFVEIVLDPVEGTSNASKGESGAISIIAGILDGEVSTIPSESEARYMDRIVAPARAKMFGVSLDASVESNVKAMMRAYKLRNASELEVVIMDRDRNRAAIDELKRLGVNLRLIDGGDLLPAIATLTSDRPMLSMGSGGKEEAIIAALGAKAAGGVFEGRYVDVDGNAVDTHFGKLHKLDNLMSGERSKTFLSFASITGTRRINDLAGNKIDFGDAGLSPVIKKTDGKFNIQAASISGRTGLLQKTLITV